MTVCRRPNCTADGRDILGGLCPGHYGAERQREDIKTKESKTMKDVSEDLECKKCHKLATDIIEKADGNRSTFNFKQGLCRSCVSGNNKKSLNEGSASKPAKTLGVRPPKKEAEFYKTDEDTITITVDFTGQTELVESIMEAATKEFRTPEMQILKILSESIDED